MSKGKFVPPVLCDTFDVKNYGYTEMDMDPKNEDNKKRSQFMCYPRYETKKHGENNFVFQTGWIKITQYGLPGIHEKYYPTDESRNFVKVPMDPEQPNCVSLRNMLSKVDEFTEQNKKKILGKYAKLYTYQPIVRKPTDPNDDFDQIEDSESDEGKEDKPTNEQKVKFEYCKMKLDVNWQTKDIQTVVYVREGGKTSEHKHVPVSTASDLDQYLTWGSEVRMIVMMNKLWAAKAKDKSGTRSFGVGMKVMQMEVVPRATSGSVREAFSRYAFIDNGDSSEEEADEESQDDQEAENESDDELDEGVDEEDEDASDDEGEDETDDEEESSEEEVVQTKKSKKSASKKSKTARK